jgi:cobyrinic acid a,c-diamide synthase
LHKISYFLEEIIELDYTSVENHRIGLDYGDVVYSNTTASSIVSNIEPWMTFPREYNGSVFEIYPV